MLPAIRGVESALRVVPCGILLLTLVACGDDGAGDTTEVDSAQPGGPQAGGDSVYGIGTLVTVDEGSTAYLRIVGDLDFNGEQVVLDAAREFSGQSDLAVHGGRLLVASGD